MDLPPVLLIFLLWLMSSNVPPLARQVNSYSGTEGLIILTPTLLEAGMLFVILILFGKMLMKCRNNQLNLKLIIAVEEEVVDS